MAEGASSVEARSQGSIQALEERTKEGHAGADGDLGDETEANAGDVGEAGADAMMNAGGECVGKGEDNDYVQSADVQQGVENGECGSASDVLGVTERLEEIERRGANGTHYREGRNGHGECDLHPCGCGALPTARRGAWMLSKAAASTRWRELHRQIARFLDNATHSVQGSASLPKTFLAAKARNQLPTLVGSTNQSAAAVQPRVVAALAWEVKRGPVPAVGGTAYAEVRAEGEFVEPPFAGPHLLRGR